MHRMFSIVVLTLALTSANTYAQDVDLVRGWDAPTVTPSPATAVVDAVPPSAPWPMREAVPDLLGHREVQHHASRVGPVMAAHAIEPRRPNNSLRLIGATRCS